MSSRSKSPARKRAGKATTAKASKPKKSAGKGAPEPLKSYWYPDREGDLREVKEGYLAGSLLGVALLMVVLSAGLYALVWSMNPAVVVRAWNTLRSELSLQRASVALGSAVVLVSALVWYVATRPRRVFLVDFAVFTPPKHLTVTSDIFMRGTRAVPTFTDESVAFQEKLLKRTGIGEQSYFPPACLAPGQGKPLELTMDAARAEAELVLTGCLESLCQKTGLRPADIDILIVNCSLFNPTPSLSAMVVNKFKLRPGTRTYNLSGMGCSAGIIAVDLAKDLLQVHKSANCVILSTENISQNWYLGNERSMLVSNTLFRVGGAAILLSNRWRDSWRSKYELLCTVRVHRGQDDAAYRSIYQAEDEDGIIGVRLSKELLRCVGGALKSNITLLGPLVLPYTEQIKFFVAMIGQRLFGKDKVRQYTPDFKRAFQHFCIHAGGRAVIDGLQENLQLSDYDVEPSRATLYRYGNTSSSSVWYELNFIEQSGRLKKNDRVWQIAIGSGIKCNSAVWTSLVSFQK